MRFVVLLLALVSCADERTLGAPCDGDCQARVHPPGILDPTSSDFHVKLLQQNDWSFALCQGCHGQDFRGGSAGVSCLACHADGPTACTTCHGTGPTTNAHLPHAAAKVACAECHIVPASWDQDGHILHAGKAITTPAVVTFGARANLTIAAADRAGPASFDAATLTCTNVYCHGAVLHAAGGVASSPVWSDPTPPGTCDRCHGNPPPSHARTDCATCHPKSAAHIDGVIDVGRVPGCSGCHGGPTSPAPPTDLSGNTVTTALGVGAHQAHLTAASHISAPVPCATCHAVPTTVDSPGHIDQTGPAVVVAALGWDRNARTCTSSYCHGPARPDWTASTQVACGSCHGLPPTDAPHTPDMAISTCATCHPGTVDTFGNIIVTQTPNGPTSEHINGSVDLH